MNDLDIDLQRFSGCALVCWCLRPKLCKFYHNDLWRLGDLGRTAGEITSPPITGNIGPSGLWVLILKKDLHKSSQPSSNWERGPRTTHIISLKPTVSVLTLVIQYCDFMVYPCYEVPTLQGSLSFGKDHFEGVVPGS